MKKSSVTNREGGSLKWIYAAKGNTTLKTKINVNAAVRTEVFGPVARDRCNLISIFGAARQGKSFLMNCLAGTTGLFTISNLSTPCTQGIDISKNMVPLKTFSEVDGGQSTTGKMMVGFVDAEGQGDRDVTYDAVSRNNSNSTQPIHYICHNRVVESGVPYTTSIQGMSFIVIIAYHIVYLLVLFLSILLYSIPNHIPPPDIPSSPTPTVCYTKLDG